MKHKINHPMADEISIVEGEDALCDEGQVEIAFFKERSWLLEPVGPFSEYFYPASATAVYANVPRGLVDSFLEEYSVGEFPESTPLERGEIDSGARGVISLITDMMREELSKRKPPKQ
jgi:hypothetical protein